MWGDPYGIAPGYRSATYQARDGIQLFLLPAMRELTTSVLLYGSNSRTLGVQIQQLRVNGYMTQDAALSMVAIAIIMK